MAQGLDQASLDRIVASMQNDVDSDVYDGGVVLVARGGEVGLHAAVGLSEQATQRQAATSDIFRIFSMTKAFTNALILKSFDRGLISPITKVVDIIPEFAGSDRFRAGVKRAVSVEHLLTHRAALSPTPWPVPPLEAGDLAHTIAAICEMDLVGIPGESVNYSPCLSHALLGEIARRTLGGGRTFTEMLQDEILTPLKMNDTSMGAPAAWDDRLVPVRAAFEPGGFFSPADIEATGEAAYEGAELPWVGCVSTVADVFRFAEMLRRGGELDGERILSPAAIKLATSNHTGDLLNDRYAKLTASMDWDPWVANIGLGYMLRGPQHYESFFGAMASPGTFGGYGAGSSQFFIDPERDLTFVCMTAGVLGEADNVRRFQRLSDMAIAAVN